MWQHKRHGKQLFKGSYEKDRQGERNFILKGSKGRRITFEMWQDAKLAGWKKVA